MTLVGPPMWFNCGAAMHNSDAECLHKSDCCKLAVQQNPHQACIPTPVKRDTQNGFIHGNCARPTSFDWELRSRSFELCFVQICRVTAEIWTNLQKPKICQTNGINRQLGDHNLADGKARSSSGNPGLTTRDPSDFCWASG